MQHHAHVVVCVSGANMRKHSLDRVYVASVDLEGDLVQELSTGLGYLLLVDGLWARNFGDLN